MKLQTLKTPLVVALPAVLTVVLFVCTFYLVVLPELRDNMISSKKETIKELTNTVWELLDDYEQRVENGELTLGEAQTRAKERIRALRYGPEGKDYFWLNDMHPVMIMHPYRTDLEGKDISTFADPQGKYLFLAFVEKVKRQNAGYVDYYWQWKDIKEKVVPKESYVKLFKPWGWIIGTGIYLKDVNSEISSITEKLNSVFLIILGVVILLSFYIIFHNEAVERKRLKAEIALRASEEQFRVIFDNAFQYIALLSKEGDILKVNKTALKAACEDENSKPEKQPFWLVDIWTDASRREVERMIKQAQKGEIARSELQTHFKNGDKVTIDLSIKPILNENSEVISLLAEGKDIMALRMMEQEKERLKAIIDNTSDLVSMSSFDKNIAFMNPAGLKMLGWKPEEVTSKKIGDVHPEWAYKKISEEGIPAAIKDGIWQGETALFDADGKVRPMSQLIISHRDSNGKLEFLSTVIRDISLQKEAEASLRESEELFRGISNNSPSLIYLKDREGRYLFINPVYEKLYNISNEELIGKTDFDIFPEHIARAFRDNDEEVLDTGLPITREEEDLVEDGTTRTYISTKFPLRDAKGEIYSVCGISTDITNRKLTEQALRESEENLQITLNSIGDAVIATDTKGVVTRMNPVAEELTGWVFVEAQGLPLENIFKIIDSKTREALDSPLLKIIDHGEKAGLAENTLLIDKYGVERLVADSGAPIRSTSGEIVGAVLVFRDVTEKYKMEAQLRQSQKMDSIGQLAGGVAHDFNNMLGGILGYGELLTKKVKDEKLHNYAETIVTTAKRAADLTNKLLAFSRKGKFLSSSLDIHDCIREAVSLLERSIDKRISLKVNMDAQVSAVVGDPSQLQNAILNLGVNARDAMPDGGLLAISTKNIYLDEVFCSASPFEINVGEYVCISFSDTGSGMSPEVQKHIFEPFYTTKDIGKGTGLGLAAVYGTVKDHHGAVSVHSQLGEGAVFNIYLPVDEHFVSIASEIHPEIEAVKGGCILIVDDEDVIRNMVSALLEDMGYTVFLAEDGEEGLEVYKKNRNEIDVAIIDMVMPKMNGKDCFRGIKKFDPDAKILLSSGFSRDTSLAELYEEGLNGFIKKPYRASELTLAISKVLTGEKADS